MGADVSIITPESWNKNCFFSRGRYLSLGIGTLSQVKQSMRWVKCIGLEGQKGRLSHM